MPYAPVGATDAIDGSEDYDALFTGPDRWPVAAGAVDVVKLYSGWVEWHATDEQLRAIVAATRARGQLLAVEIGPLVGTEVCGLDVEGFNASLEPIRRIHAAGGTVALVAFDEPLAFGHLYRDVRACEWTVERVARATAAFVRELRSIEPEIRVGDIEPLWSDLEPSELGDWMDAYRQAAGESFAFFHLDVDWSMSGWRDWVAAAAREIRSRGVSLGAIYIGGQETSDASWTDAARANIDGVEQALGGRPDEVIFQSWFHFPRHALPETDLSTLTGLVRQYATARRTTVALSSESSGVLTGRALSLEGAPLAGAQLAVWATPLDGGYAELRMMGSVPVDAKTALVGLRVNIEGAGAGATPFSLYRLSYTEDDGTNLVPDPAFARGRDVWGSAGSATVRFTTSDRGAGTMVRISATATQTLEMNGSEFRVSPGKRFDLVARVNAPPLGAEAPLVILVFLSGTEVSRTSVPVQPPERSIGDPVTDASGAFSVDLPPFSGRLRVEARYAGDLGHWRAVRELVLTQG